MVEKYECNVLLEDLSDHLPSIISLADLGVSKKEPVDAAYQ